MTMMRFHSKRPDVLPAVEDVRDVLLIHLESLIIELLPGAKRVGSQFRVGSINGEPGESLAIDAATGLWIDHATGEKGDPINLVMIIHQVDFPEALQWAQQWLGISYTHRTEKTPSRPCSAPPKQLESHDWPFLIPCSPLQLKQIASVLNIGLPGLILASERGQLFASGSCYTITDRLRYVRADRRFDGGEVRLASGQLTKTRTLGSATWPVGASSIEPFPYVILCEGLSDFLASYSLITHEGLSERFGSCAILGASTKIHPEALSLFRSKHVLIFADNDPAGIGGARRWRDQLTKVAKVVKFFDLSGLNTPDGKPINDLRDFLSLDVDDWEREGELREPLAHFISQVHS